MTFRTLTAAALGLTLATGALAMTLTTDAGRHGAAPQPPRPPQGTTTLSLSVVPEWLKEPIRRAIADATDPRPRK